MKALMVYLQLIKDKPILEISDFKLEMSYVGKTESLFCFC